MANDGEIKVQVTASTAPFDKALKNSKKEAEKFDKEVDKVTSGSVKALEGETKKAAEGVKGLGESVKKTTRPIKALGDETKKAQTGVKGFSDDAKKAVPAVKALSDETKKARDSAKAFTEEVKKTTPAVDKFSKDTERAGKRGAKKFKEETKKAGDEATKLGRKTKKATPPIKKFQSALKQAAESSALLTGPLGGIASRLSILSRVSSVSGAAVLGFSVALGAVTLGLAKAISESEKFETSGFRIQAVLKATGMSAGFTAQQIRELSRETALNTLASTEGVEAAAAKLLTFRTVQGDVFKEAIRLSQDLAEIGFGSVEAGAVGLGKALQDPATGLTLLTRQGALTKAQQRKIGAEFERTGNLAQAQAAILKALDEQVGGAGVAAAKGLAGAYDSLSQAVSEFLQSVGDSGPLEIWTDAMVMMTKAINNQRAAFFKTPQDNLQGLLADRIALEKELVAVLERQQRFSFGGRGEKLVVKNIEDKISGINKEIRAIQNKRVEEIKATDVARKAAIAAKELAEAEAKAAKIFEAQEKERKRLAKLRLTTVRTIEEEVAALEQLSLVYIDSALTANEFARAEAKVAAFSKLSFDAASAEGLAVDALIEKKMRLTQALAEERAARESTKNNAAALSAINVEIESTRTLTNAIGKSAEEFREARVVSKAYRLEQELIASALTKQEALSKTQVTSIQQQARAMAEATVQLEDFQEVQDKMFTAEEEAASSRLEFQEQMAAGFTNLIFEADSVEDAMKRMILSISRAIVEANILNSIKFLSGGATSPGGGGPGGGIFSALFSSLIGGGGGGGGGFGAGDIGSSGGTGAADSLGLFSGGSPLAAVKMHTGGIVGSSGQTVNSAPSTFISAPRFHNGLRPDEFPAILQKGEEVTPKDKVGNERGRSRGDVIFNVVTPDADSFRASKRQFSRQLKADTANT